MQVKIFSVPVFGSAGVEEDLNKINLIAHCLG